MRAVSVYEHLDVLVVCGLFVRVFLHGELIGRADTCLRRDNGRAEECPRKRALNHVTRGRTLQLLIAAVTRGPS